HPGISTPEFPPRNFHLRWFRDQHQHPASQHRFMIQLEKTTTDLFPKLHEAFLHDDNPLSTKQDWRNVFDQA
ncbi:MAG: hypothetical protein OSA98_15980, partial [Rubripirellula sp.]|nr:hypothetical protein [Rubripirellula sp.]